MPAQAPNVRAAAERAKSATNVRMARAEERPGTTRRGRPGRLTAVLAVGKRHRAAPAVAVPGRRAGARRAGARAGRAQRGESTRVPSAPILIFLRWREGDAVAFAPTRKQTPRRRRALAEDEQMIDGLMSEAA